MFEIKIDIQRCTTHAHFRAKCRLFLLGLKAVMQLKRKILRDQVKIFIVATMANFWILPVTRRMCVFKAQIT